MTVSSPACTVFINGSYVGNCPTNPTLKSFFGTSPIVMDIFYGLIVASFVLGALFIITKYREKPLGRFLEGWTGLIGIGRLRGLPSQVGKITPISDKVGFFDAGRGRDDEPIEDVHDDGAGAEEAPERGVGRAVADVGAVDEDGAGRGRDAHAPALSCASSSSKSESST